MQTRTNSIAAAIAAMATTFTTGAPATADTDWTGFSGGVQLGYGDINTSGPSLNGDGVLYGFRGYYDFDFGQFVVGAGGQYDFADIDIGGATTLDSVGRLGVRGGFDLNRSWLYATGGYAYASTSATAIGDSNGWFAGVGFETYVTDSVTIGTEVLYHQFRDFTLNTLEVDATTASVSVNFRF